MTAHLHALLIAARLCAGLLLPLGLVYGWLWLFAQAGVVLGPTAALLVLAAGPGVIWVYLRNTKHAPLGFYQPWDSGYWILAQRLTGHWWQQPPRTGTI